MNVILATIEDLQHAGGLTLLLAESGGHMLTSVLVESQASKPELEPGKRITLCFKETEVAIGLEIDMPISMRNRIPGTINRVEEGLLLSRIHIDTSLGPISSLITTGSSKRLGLTNGMQVCAFIKTNEIMLQDL